MERNATLDLLTSFEEDLVYAIECLTEDFTGEAKSELSGLVATISSTEGLPPGWRDSLVSSLEPPLLELRQNSYSAAARTALVAVRRRLANTRRGIQGLPQIYNYAAPLT